MQPDLALSGSYESMGIIKNLTYLALGLLALVASFVMTHDFRWVLLGLGVLGVIFGLLSDRAPGDKTK